MPDQQVKRVWGFRQQDPDHRDWRFYLPTTQIDALPSHVDLRAKLPPAYDQGRIGSCTANAIAAALEHCRAVQGLPRLQPSRLFIYWNERDMEGTTNRDAGAIIRDGIKVVASVGCPREAQWSYDDTPADPLTGIFAASAKARQKPSCFAYRYAKDLDAVAYLSVAPAIDQIRGCLAQGFPVVFGFQVFAGFESEAVGRSGVLNLPTPGEANLGGHAVLAVGYDDATQRLIVRNSWGTGWGDAGYFTLPFDYVLAYGSDFWTIRGV